MPKDDKKPPPAPKDNEVATLQKVLLSLPTIFALTGTSTVLFFEQTWTRNLEISLPHGVGATSGTSPLLPQILIYLLLIALFFAAVVIVVVLIGYLVLSFVGGGRAAWSQRHAFELAARKIYGLVAPETTPEGAEEGTKTPRSLNEEAIAELWVQRAKARSGSAEFWKSGKGYLRNALSRVWEVLFGTADVTLPVAAVRIAVLSVSALAVLLLTADRAKEHVEQLAGERDAQGQKLEQPLDTLPCETLTVTALPIGWPRILGRSEVPCGRVTLTSGYAVDASRLVDPERTGTVSVPVFHLGRYGDWVVLAPLGAPSERVFVQARHVLEFSQMGPRLLQVSNDPSEEDEAPWREAMAKFLARLDKLEAGALGTDQVEKIIDDALDAHVANVPWEAALTSEREARRKADDILRTELRAYLKEDTEARATAWQALVDALARLSEVLDDPLQLDMPQVWVGILDETESISAVQDIQQHFAQAFRQTMTAEHKQMCASTLLALPPVVFGEGSIEVSDEDAARMVQGLVDLGWTPDGTQGLFLLELEGFASGTGLSGQNALLAERRADAVKRALVRAAFRLGSSESPDALGPELLTRARLVVVADGGGEALDGAGANAPRRVTIRMCQVSGAISETAGIAKPEVSVAPLQIKN